MTAWVARPVAEFRSTLRRVRARRHGGAMDDAPAAARRWLLPRRKRYRVGVIALVLLIATGAVTHIVVDRLTSLPEGVVLAVGETEVTEGQFQRRTDVLRALYGVRPPEAGPARDRFRRAAAKSMAVSMLMEQEARERGITVSDKQARAQLNIIVSRAYPQGSDAFLRRLSTQGVSQRDMVAELKRQIANSRLFVAVTKDVAPVTEDDISRALAQRDPAAIAPERRTLRNIVVKTQQQATRLVRRADSEAAFQRLAKRFSLDGSTRNRGGELGTVTADQLDAAYAKAAFAANPGSVFGPVRTKFGWNVGMVERVHPPKPLPEQEIKANLAEERKLGTWQSWLAELIRNAPVRYADAYRPADPYAAPGGAP